MPNLNALYAICRHFGVDARILNEPLEILTTRHQKPNAHKTLMERQGFDLVPAHHEILPDGVYAEWKHSWGFAGKIRLHLISVSTKANVRAVRVKVSRVPVPLAANKRFNPPTCTYEGIAYHAPGGFVTFDQGQEHTTRALAFTVYERHENDERFFYGYKLSSLVLNNRKHHFHGTILLERLERNLSAIKNIARMPIELKMDDAPSHVQKLLA